MSSAKELVEAARLRRRLYDSTLRSEGETQSTVFGGATIPPPLHPSRPVSPERPTRKVSIPSQIPSTFWRKNYDASLDECRKKASNPQEPTIDGDEPEGPLQRHPTETDTQYFSREAFQAIVTDFAAREDKHRGQEKERDEEGAEHDTPFSKKFLKRQERNATKKEHRRVAKQREKEDQVTFRAQKAAEEVVVEVNGIESEPETTTADLAMSSPPPNTISTPSDHPPSSPTKGHDKPLVLGRTKPIPKMDPAKDTKEVAARDESDKPSITTTPPPKATTKKEKSSKQPKAPAPSAPLSPALIDLRVGHILRAIAHPNADSLYVSTIAMGDPEGTEHTVVDEATGKVVRTVCSGLNGLVPLDAMQDRKIIVVANLKPVNMRSIKSAAMVLAASPKPEEGADPHAHDRVVELVMPPEGSEAGDKVYFEGWPYGEGKGPEKVLNPKKKQWEAIQPGFYTTDDLVVGFDAGKSEMDGEQKGDLVVEGKGKCTVKTLKGAVVR